MRKNFGSKTWVYPMPVFIIGTYDEDKIMKNVYATTSNEICGSEINGIYNNQFN